MILLSCVDCMSTIAHADVPNVRNKPISEIDRRCVLMRIEVAGTKIFL